MAEAIADVTTPSMRIPAPVSVPSRSSKTAPLTAKLLSYRRQYRQFSEQALKAEEMKLRARRRDGERETRLRLIAIRQVRVELRVRSALRRVRSSEHERMEQLIARLERKMQSTDSPLLARKLAMALRRS